MNPNPADWHSNPERNSQVRSRGLDHDVFPVDDVQHGFVFLRFEDAHVRVVVLVPPRLINQLLMSESLRNNMID